MASRLMPRLIAWVASGVAGAGGGGYAAARPRRRPVVVGLSTAKSDRDDVVKLEVGTCRDHIAADVAHHAELGQDCFAVYVRRIRTEAVQPAEPGGVDHRVPLARNSAAPAVQAFADLLPVRLPVCAVPSKFSVVMLLAIIRAQHPSVAALSHLAVWLRQPASLRVAMQIPAPIVR